MTDKAFGAPVSQDGLSQAEPKVSALTGFDPSRMPRLLRALAHDCESTDGWEDAAPDLHDAADRLLVLEIRLSDLAEWAQKDHVTEPATTLYEQAWDAGYSSARGYVGSRTAEQTTSAAEATAPHTAPSSPRSESTSGDE